MQSAVTFVLPFVEAKKKKKERKRKEKMTKEVCYVKRLAVDISRQLL
jgi:hypothetical protein